MTMQTIRYGTGSRPNNYRTGMPKIGHKLFTYSTWENCMEIIVSKETQRFMLCATLARCSQRGQFPCPRFLKVIAELSSQYKMKFT